MGSDYRCITAEMAGLGAATDGWGWVGVGKIGGLWAAGVGEDGGESKEDGGAERQMKIKVERE